MGKNKKAAPRALHSLSIGKTIASDRFQNTMDNFWFFLYPRTIINTFDFVTVDNVYGAKTIGIVKELQAVLASSLDDQRKSVGIKKKLGGNRGEGRSELPSSGGVVVAKAAILSNTSTSSNFGKAKNLLSINMPVGIGRHVRFARAKEVMVALGIPQMANPIPAGVIEMTSGLQIPLSLDISYLLGPDTAHINATGISGNLKTSYLLFLLQAVYQKLGKYGNDPGIVNSNTTDDQGSVDGTGIAIIIFNTKEADLLCIDKRKPRIKKKSKELFDLLDLEAEPFGNVTYFLPRGRNGKPLSSYVPENSKTYSYLLEDVYDRLELLFSETFGSSLNLLSIVNFIYESWPLRFSSGKMIQTWSDLAGFRDYPPEIIANRSGLDRFIGHLQEFSKSPLFPDGRVTSTYLGRQIKEIQIGDVFVIDIAMIPTVQHQAFVVGDVMKSVDEMYSARIEEETTTAEDGSSGSGRVNKKGTKKPRYILIFIDEINRFVPRSGEISSISAVASQTMRTIMAGRSRGTILFSAQQFKSTVNDALHENTGLHILAKLGMSELSTSSYNMLDKSTKLSISRLNKGELVLVHPAFRHPVRISFPAATIKKQTIMRGKPEE